MAGGSGVYLASPRAPGAAMTAGYLGATDASGLQAGLKIGAGAPSQSLLKVVSACPEIAQHFM